MIEVDAQLLVSLQQAIAQMDLNVDEHQQQQLIRYVQLLDKWNQAYNLTSVRDPQDMISKHIVDSIAVSPFLDGDNFIDVGTGPGLPGIPLAILHPEKTFVLLDSLGKRVRFMKQVAFELNLANIQPVQSRVEQYTSDIALDAVLSRAFASLKDMLHWCAHLVDSHGKFVALKGQYPQAEIADMPTGFAVQQVHELDIPGLDGARHLIVIKQQAGKH